MLPEAKKWEIYTDESYMHEHYNKNKNLIWDLNSKKNSMREKAKHKRCCNCFCAVIQKRTPRAPDFF
jgi:ribonuclease HI